MSVSAFLKRNDTQLVIDWFNETVTLDRDNSAYVWLELTIRNEGTGGVSNFTMLIEGKPNEVKNESAKLLDEKFMRNIYDSYNLRDFIRREIEFKGRIMTVPTEVEVNITSYEKFTEIQISFSPPLQVDRVCGIVLKMKIPDFVTSLTRFLPGHCMATVNFYRSLPLPINQKQIAKIKEGYLWIFLPPPLLFGLVPRELKFYTSEDLQRLQYDKIRKRSILWWMLSEILDWSTPRSYTLTYSLSPPIWLIWLSIFLGMIGFLLSVLRLFL